MFVITSFWMQILIYNGKNVTNAHVSTKFQNDILYIENYTIRY
jgi:hypothetical protein